VGCGVSEEHQQLCSTKVEAVYKRIKQGKVCVCCNMDYLCRPSLAQHTGTCEVQARVDVHNCLHHKAPQYLMDYCIPISDVASRRHLRSARRHYLVVPRQSFSSYGRRAFAVAGPTAWNSLSDDLRDTILSTDSFRRLLKTRLFSEYIVHTAP